MAHMHQAVWKACRPSAALILQAGVGEKSRRVLLGRVHRVADKELK